MVVCVIEAMKIILNLFIYFFFSRKDFKRKKSTKRKTSDFYPLRSLCAQKIVAVVVFCSLVFVLFVGFLFVSVFIRAGFFLSKKKKKINRLKIIFVTSITYTTDVYPSQPTYREFICTHLFLLVIIWEKLFFLWKSFWILFISENLFFLWKSFLSVRISSFS